MHVTPLFIGDERGLRDATFDFISAMPELRRRKGLSRKALAEAVGVSSEMIRAVENRKRKPSESLEYKLHQTLA